MKPLDHDDIQAAYDALRQADSTKQSSSRVDTGYTLMDTPPVSPDYSDDAMALTFSTKHNGELLYVPKWSRWLCWDGCRWVEDSTLAVFDRVRVLCRDTSAVLATRKSNSGVSPRSLCDAKTVTAVERLARSDRRHARDGDGFDADPWLLNTPGGTVELKTGQCRPQDPNDLLTKLAGATPGGDCPRWRAFIHEATSGDELMAAYVQRWAGYTLTGVVSENAFLFAWGPGGNGKSVLLGTMAAALGDYATTAMADVFTMAQHDQHPTALAALRGARMVVVTETEAGRPWAESRIKSLTGGDAISARVMRGDPFTFTPAFKLWIAGNHRPVLRNPDAAMRRRLHLVPLTYVPPNPDKALPGALREELPGILAWAIEGCLAWQREGLNPPEAVIQASASYFEDQDSLVAWFAERCVRDPGSSEPARKLYQDWKKFAEDRGETPGSEKAFSDSLERLAAKKRTKTGVVFIGVRLKPSETGSW